MIERLSEVQNQYSVTNQAFGTVTFGPRTSQLSKKGNKNRYLMLAAKGTAMNDLNEPHITIWGNSQNDDAYISTVEFSWASTKHVRYHRHSGQFTILDMPLNDMALAEKLKILLKLFLNASTIDAFAIEPEKPVSPVTTKPKVSFSPDSEGYKDEYPAL